MSEPLLSVRDLSITYHGHGGDVPAVRGVSFDVEKGDSLGLAGESGCGKSTLANSILRLLPAGTEVTGQIVLDGKDVLNLSPGGLRAARWTSGAIVFQGALHALNPVQTVGEQIGEPMLVHKTAPNEAAARKRVIELLGRVGLSDARVDSYPHQLSGGQRQRVLIAMALACDPLLLIADEPTTALDLMVQAQVLDLLATSRGAGPDLDVHHPRSLGAHLRLSTPGRDVRRADRGGRPGLGGLRERFSSLHACPGCGISHHRGRDIPNGALGIGRRPTHTGQPAGRLSLPSSMPVGA